MLTDQQLIEALLSRCPTLTSLQGWLEAQILPVYLLRREHEITAVKPVDRKRQRKAMKREAKWETRNKLKTAKSEFYRKSQEALLRDMRDNPDKFKMPSSQITPEEAAQKIAEARAKGLDIPEYRRNK
jgi:hypothetical protein